MTEVDQECHLEITNIFPESFKSYQENTSLLWPLTLPSGIHPLSDPSEDRVLNGGKEEPNGFMTQSQHLRTDQCFHQAIADLAYLNLHYNIA